MSAELDRLTASVTNMTTVNKSVIALVQGLAQQIRDLKDDPTKLAALADEIDADAADAAAAVTQNTSTPPTA